ncbi:hypothetical protein DFJ58DRAFT_838723 [Suillus subalutaceus]|uniref:uncharacterized protein n=1 Tax=Suillus subalutaceus TaxID=48586 RepID=UPI001B86774D|nr:uncharacterized protein DFJ58DRAFT_838723 [Suillus subalutaceus]KAG1864984.1 hypothetical protein DFJ58DRAFT_838723 [Suillus subalutaceus]
MAVPPPFVGYRQVDSSGPDEGYLSEDVFYVTVDLGAVEPTLLPSSSTFRLVGWHDTVLGSELLFTETKNMLALPSDVSNSKRYSYEGSRVNDWARMESLLLATILTMTAPVEDTHFITEPQTRAQQEAT